mgnify:CR=1 FL=1
MANLKVKTKMTTKEAIEFLKWLSENTPYTIKHETGEDFTEIAQLLQELENKNIIKQTLVTKFSSECDEYQKNLDQIDLWAMEIQNLIKKIREKI